MTPPVFLPSLSDPTLTSALAGWPGPQGGGAVLALVAESSRSGIAGLQEACRSRGWALVGGVFPAVHNAGAFVAQGAWLVGLPPGSSVGLVDDLAGQGGAAAARIASAVGPAGDDQGVLFLLFDSMVPNIASILDDLYLELADSVRYLGVCAGSETFQPIPCLFDANRQIGGGLAWIKWDQDCQTALAHCYRVPAQTFTATSATGNKVLSIDWKPAFAVYQERIRAQYGVELTRENFYTYAVHFPFGILLANGQSLVRIPVGLDEGGIYCVGEVPVNSLLILLEAPAPGSSATLDSLDLENSQARSGEDWLVFYCAGRRMHLGNDSEAELKEFARRSRGNLVGALSLGEIGSLEDGGYPFFHNGAIVSARWPGC